MLDTSMEDNKENTGYFSDNKRFEVDTLDDAAERSNAAERYGDISTSTLRKHRTRIWIANRQQIQQQLE